MLMTYADVCGRILTYAVLDNSDPICDGNCLTNGAGRGLVIMDNAKGTYRFAY
jgi:hypothetical protein